MEASISETEDIKEINILILDDEKPIQRMLGRLLYSNGYPYSVASDTREARSIMEIQKIGLVLCDVNLPGESGIDFIKYTAGAYPETAIIMVTAYDDAELIETALDMGVYGYVIKPFRPSEMMINISNALRRRSLETLNRMNLNDMEEIIRERTLELQKTTEKLEKIIEGIIRAIALTIETREPYTAGHQQRTAELAKAISMEMGLSDDQVEAVHMAALTHDLGKLATYVEVFEKAVTLKEIESDLMKTYPKSAYDILKDIDFPWPIAAILLQHHERPDGSGYPQGISGKDGILLEARILAVADAFDTAASHVPSNLSEEKENPMVEIQKGKGSLYDPAVVDACMKLINSGKYDSIFPHLKRKKFKGE